MYKHMKNGKVLEFLKEEEGRFYYLDLVTLEEVDYAESTAKRYIKQIGTIIEIDVLTDEEYIILKQGNYVPQWILGGKKRVAELDGFVEKDSAGYITGTYAIFDNKKSKVRHIEKFKRIIKELPEVLDATSSKPLTISKVGRESTKELLLTGMITLGPNGLYVKKQDLNLLGGDK